MKTTVSLVVLSLAGWSVLGTCLEAQGQMPGRSLTGGSWYSTNTQDGPAGEKITLRGQLTFDRNKTYTGTWKQSPWGPFFKESVTHVHGNWWMEDDHTLVMFGRGGPSFRGFVRWLDNNTIEAYEPLTGAKSTWKRKR